MKTFFKVIIWGAAAICISAFLAPLLYLALPFKFEKILNRLLMISIVIVMVKFIRIDRLFLIDCGLKRSVEWRRWFYGFFTSVIVISLLSLIERGVGALQLSDGIRFSGTLVFSALMTGVVVGIFEEFFFRGFIFLKLKNATNLSAAFILTNLFYSLTHFIKNGRPLISGSPTWWDSFRVLAASFQAFSDWASIWPAFVGLFLFGMVLSAAFLKTRTLYLSMGIHAGAVFFLKLTNHWFEPQSGFQQFIFGGKSFYSGVLGWVAIGIIGLAVYFASGKATCSETPLEK